MPKRRRWDEQPERDPKDAGRRQLARLDTAARVGIFEELQRAGGNSAVQRVVGPRLQRDSTTAEKPASSWTASRIATPWALSVDGKVVGGVRSVAGCSVRSEVVTETGASRIGMKHTGGVQYEPCVLQVGLGMGAEFFDWIRDTFSAKRSVRDLTLHSLDASSRETAQLALQRTLLTKLELPELAASDTSPAWLTLTVMPEVVKRSAGSGAKVDTKLTSDPLNPSTVRLEVSEIGGVPELTSVAAWAFEQIPKKIQVGESRYPDLEPTVSKLGELRVTLAESGKGSKSAIAGFDAWLDDMVKGNAAEKTAVLSV